MLSGARRQRIDAYGLGRLDDMSPLFDDLYAAAKALGLPVRTLMSEYAPGQFEITLEHRADALRAVDEAILFKRAGAGRRGTARSRGLLHGEAVRGTRGIGAASACEPGGQRGRQCLRRRRPRRQPAAAPRHRRAAGDAGGGHGLLRAERQLVSPLPLDELRPGGRRVGRQQPLREPARTRGPARQPARRTSRRRRGCQSVPGCGAGARGRCCTGSSSASTRARP